MKMTILTARQVRIAELRLEWADLDGKVNYDQFVLDYSPEESNALEARFRDVKRELHKLIVEEAAVS